ncbi:MAG: choline dehydrogenase [Rhizobiales bacterium]|nr:choline dehydrogenase [Hyphomicrobiales bacterium]
MTDAYDFIIVGAGSAGSVLAARLSEDPKNRVLVLEYGGSDRSVFIQMPSALSIPMNSSRYNWGYHTEPEPHLGNRMLNLPRGKVIGGSSSINGLVYVRGHALDFDAWEEMGARNWAYRDVLPYFRRAEHRAEGGDEYRGDAGPLGTRYGALTNPLYRAFIEAGRQAGYAESADLNGYRQEGFGRLDMTVEHGRRASTANAYLKPALRRPNLRLVTHALVTGIVLDGTRATGVRYRIGEDEHVATATREVILSAGPINSPQLLKLSGIGPREELRRHGIAVVADRPGVGANLQDHLEFYFQFASKLPITLYSSLGLFARGQIGATWLLTHGGLGATNHFEAGAFIRSRAGIEYPDIQYHFVPLAADYDGNKLASEHGFQAHVGPMRSKSRGAVTLRSADPREAPRVRFNYMSVAEDWEEMRACVRLTRELFRQSAFDPYRGREIQPGAGVTSDAAIDDFIRERVESAFHPCGSARMGAPGDPGAVVDPATRVLGTQGLRVVDSSIMPRITNGNLNAPTIMIGEKAADLILGRTPLAPSNAPFHVAADWREAQR